MGVSLSRELFKGPLFSLFAIVYLAVQSFWAVVPYCWWLKSPGQISHDLHGFTRFHVSHGTIICIVKGTKQGNLCYLPYKKVDAWYQQVATPVEGGLLKLLFTRLLLASELQKPTAIQPSCFTNRACLRLVRGRQPTILGSIFIVVLGAFPRWKG